MRSNLYCLEDADREPQTTNTILDDFGLSPRARLCLRAAREAENQKIANRKKIDDMRIPIEKTMKELEDYRESCEKRGVSYYDSFKLHKYEEDFLANVQRLELASMWNEIIEMLKKYQLPDGFEGDKTWVDMGTRYRRLTEPLDIANYYKNALYKETEKYLKPGSRPKRYPFTQRWYEYSYMKHGGTSGESTFWAELEQLKITMTDKNTPFEDVKESVLELEKNLKRWYDKGEIRKDTFLPESTLVNWWKTLPEEHRAASPIKDLISS
ncbi:hypothetical protein SAY87_027085 [Trapa incisa]|uniref:EDS1 EP domain-containing protein n=1 Tax=Trapa incisa TaxID=236973 RepID=A0AAN7GMS6_9MYRT|nr:hypothetical protein SAY87_027085 [Trapa incisa]